jgi:hypothetical protein
MMTLAPSNQVVHRHVQRHCSRQNSNCSLAVARGSCSPRGLSTEPVTNSSRAAQLPAAESALPAKQHAGRNICAASTPPKGCEIQKEPQSFVQPKRTGGKPLATQQLRFIAGYKTVSCAIIAGDTHVLCTHATMLQY